MTGTALTVPSMKNVISGMHEKGELPLPSHVSVTAFMNAAVVALTDNPDIAKCDQGSVFKSLRKIAGMGLVPDGHEAALVPFNQKVGQSWVKACQAMPMVAGLRKLAMNSGNVSDLRWHLVYQKEVEQERFVLTYGDDSKLIHNPILFGERGPVVGVYAIAILKGGEVLREFMDVEDVEKIRRGAASQRTQKDPEGNEPKGVWKLWWDQMAGKTVLRRLTKRLPLSPEDRTRIMEADGDDVPSMKDITPEPRTLQEKLNAARTKPAEEAPPHDAETGEIIDPPNPDNAFPGSAEFEAGEKAAQDGQGFNDNPYAGGQKADDWAGGWLKAKDAEPAEQEQDGG